MKCPNCGKIVPDKAKVCGYCGRKLMENEPQKNITEPIKKARTKNKDIPQPVESEGAPKKKTPIWLWLGGVGSIVVLAIVLALLFSHPKTETFTIASISPQTNIGKTSLPQESSTISPGTELLNERNYFTGFLQGKLVNPKVLFYEDFENWQNSEWYTSTNVSTARETGAVLKIPGVEGLKAYLCSQQYYQNRAILTKFKLTGQTYQMEFFVSQNQWATPEYMRFGGAIYNTDQLQTTIWEGTNNDLSNIVMDGTLRYEANRWYGLFIGQDKNGNFLISSWALDNPDGEYTGYSIRKTGAWTSGMWNSCFQVGEGTLYVDDFMIMAFDEIDL